MKKLALSLLLGLWVMPSFAQIPVKAEDNFWRRRVAVRVELDEKMNLPFKFHDKSDFQNFRFSETNGIVMAILNAVKDGELTGYDAHTWEVLSGKRILQRMKYLEQAWNKGKNDMEGEKTADKWDNIFVADDAAEYALSASFTEMPSDGMFTTDVYNKKKAHGQWDMDLTPYEKAIILVDDWIFDKNSSAMRYNTQYIQIVWVDPSGTLPEHVLANFKYEDLTLILEKAQWKARWNDVPNLNIRQALDLHLYHGFPINISGQTINTMDESQRRYQELIEFESYLWSN